MKNPLSIIFIIVGVAVFTVLSGALYIVDETEQVVVTRFGKPVGEPIFNAGLKFKMPFIDVKNSFEKRILQWDGDANQITTGDKKFIHVDTFARWRIAEPLKFYQSLRNELSAQGRLDDIIDGATRNVLAGKPLIEMVRNSTRSFVVSEFGVEVTDEEILKQIEFGRSKIVGAILAQAAPALKPYGIQLEDVQIKRTNYVESVRVTVYDRMISERKRAAEKFRSEGQGEKAKIEGQIERDLLKIQSEAKKEAQELRGIADNKALQTLARAYGLDPDFFGFYQTLQTYANSIKDDTKFILSTDNDYIKYLKRLR